MMLMMFIKMNINLFNFQIKPSQAKAWKLSAQSNQKQKFDDVHDVP